MYLFNILVFVALHISYLHTLDTFSAAENNIQDAIYKAHLIKQETNDYIVRSLVNETRKGVFKIHNISDDKVALNLKIYPKETIGLNINISIRINNILSDQMGHEEFNINCIHGYESIEHESVIPWIAITICGNMLDGFASILGNMYLITATRINLRSKRSTLNQADNFFSMEKDNNQSYFNLVGDTFDSTNVENITTEEPFKNKYKTWSMEQDDEELGYFYDSAWKTVITKPRKTDRQISKNYIHRYLQIVVGIDDSVIKFHGQKRVKQYVLTLLNIVNAIYQDPSLDAQLQIAVKKIHFYEKRRSIIRLGNAKKSLDNVNAWNALLHDDYNENEEPHDVALWLTRVDIGGPSGYAPVGGVCDPKRSCALARDEGLTCAFVIAHELAHVLGLSHDGNTKVNNTCVDDAQLGSIMAPMVSATFRHFLWSDCSRQEFAAKIKQWDCLIDEPNEKSAIILNSTLTTKFSMDEQCRVEFGEGYVLCTSFAIEPCAHLWCAHINSPLVCKTKKGPPLEGTECGPNKWCIDGYCDNTLRINLDPLKYNPQDGGWSNWLPWTPCSRTCGLGVQFHTRKCDNPIPAYNGLDCIGKNEEWRVCNTQECAHSLGDFRAQQCQRMPQLLDVPNNYTWLPYESEQKDLKCKFICQTRETSEIYASDENLIDGTSCSYDSDNRRCVQGQCIDIGCDNIVNSTLIEDACGVCNGNNSQCIRIATTAHKKIKKQITRLGVIHKHARHVAMELEIFEDVESIPLKIQDITLYYKDRKRNKYVIQRPDVKFHRKLHDADNKPSNNNINDVHVWGDDEDQHEEYVTTTTIFVGSKFRCHGYRSMQNRKQAMTIFLSANGPLLSELVLFIEIKPGLRHSLRVQLQTEYLIHKKFKESKYEWIVGGWGSCSQSCGGGKMFKTKACVEKNTQNIVARQLCSIATKPPTEIQICNNFSCNFVWVPGDWEACSTTCGKNGVQYREIYCVPQTVMESTNESYNLSESVLKAPWKFMLPPTKCGYQPPPTSRSCARTFCPGHWAYSAWSNCSSCKNGIQMREAYCYPDINTSQQQEINESMRYSYRTNEFDNGDLNTQKILTDDYFSCGTDIGPKQYQYCSHDNPSCEKVSACLGDTSAFCSLSILKRYCKIDSFRELCCRSCSLYSLNPIQI